MTKVSPAVQSWHTEQRLYESGYATEEKKVCSHTSILQQLHHGPILGARLPSHARIPNRSVKTLDLHRILEGDGDPGQWTFEIDFLLKPCLRFGQQQLSHAVCAFLRLHCYLAIRAENIGW